MAFKSWIITDRQMWLKTLSCPEDSFCWGSAWIQVASGHLWHSYATELSVISHFQRRVDLSNLHPASISLGLSVLSVGEFSNQPRIVTTSWLRLAVYFDNVVRVVRSSSLFNLIPSSDRCIAPLRVVICPRTVLCRKDLIVLTGWPSRWSHTYVVGRVSWLRNLIW